MSGRFFALPFFVAISTLASLLPGGRFPLITGAALSAFLIISPVSPLWFGTSRFDPYHYFPSAIDTKHHVYRQGAALLGWNAARGPYHVAWYRAGVEIRARGEKVHVGGAFGKEAIGFAGFAAGPGVHLVDLVGLSDPLLARLPAIRRPDFHRWKSGHFHRAIPAGYVESLREDANLIESPCLHRYYDVVRMLTRGSLWSGDRIAEIVKMNFAVYDAWLREDCESGPVMEPIPGDQARSIHAGARGSAPSPAF
jgi:arabinofuranosyltransferase